MSYDVQLYRKETKIKEQQANDEDFFDNEQNLEPFTAAQRQELHERLLNYEYVVNTEKDGETTYDHEEEESVSALLTNNALYFSSTGEGIFEISMTASEFTDTGDFVKYDPQNGGWEEES